ARAGMRVVMLSERGEELGMAAEAIQARGGEAAALVMDLSRAEEVARVVERAEVLLGPLALVVNNAGVGLQASLAEESMQDVRRVFEVNFFALASICQQALHAMAERRRGHLINVSSASAKRGLPRLNAYSASKAAVHVFTQSL